MQPKKLAALVMDEIEIIKAAAMQLDRQERGIYSAEASAFDQRSSAFPGRCDPTPFRVSELPIEITVKQLVNPRFRGMNSALHLHRSGEA